MSYRLAAFFGFVGSSGFALGGLPFPGTLRMASRAERYLPVFSFLNAT
jgi:hypothetical protein